MRAVGAGSHITIGSVSDHIAYPENGAYTATKYGLRGLHERSPPSTGVRAFASRWFLPARLTLPSGIAFDPDQHPGLPTPSTDAPARGRGRGRRVRRDSPATRYSRVASADLEPGDNEDMRSAVRRMTLYPAGRGALRDCARADIALLDCGPEPCLRAQAIPPLPDSTGWGVHVLAVARDPQGALWVGTYGQGIFRLPPGATTWERIRQRYHSPASISWDFVHAFAFGPRGEIWYGTVGNGWGLSQDGGVTWTNWTFQQLGPEWQYVAPNGIAIRGDTTWVGTADGVQVTTDDGAHWIALGDSDGPAGARAGRYRDRDSRQRVCAPDGSRPRAES